MGMIRSTINPFEMVWGMDKEKGGIHPGMNEERTTDKNAEPYRTLILKFTKFYRIA